VGAAGAARDRGGVLFPRPDVIDDAVDELIELVPDGAPAAHDRVALTLRSS
jgi:hypothetical protein